VPNESLSIQFLTHEPEHLPVPTPAAQHIPEWLKQMPPEVICTKAEPVGPNSTVKRCMPFVDAITCGYVLPLAGDVKFYMADAKNLDIVSPEKLVTWQNDEVFPGEPFGPRLIIKFINPWVLQTPPGYSTLFVPLLNKFVMPFQILAGLVETDTYYNEVYFPAICMLRPGQFFEMARGTPFVQAIPIKREVWQSTIGQIDNSRLAESKAALRANTHLYREANWAKKTYR
jgi:hypothetical protein